jgi:hypothetical protein
LLPKEEKIRGSTTFWAAAGVLCHILWVLVITRLWVWESLKTLFYVIMLLYDSVCIGYGHVSLVWTRCYLFVLGCLSFILNIFVWWLSLTCYHSQVR